MSKINLLPWREELKKQKQQEFFMLLGAFAVFAAITVGIVHFVNVQQIAGQQARNKYMEDQIVFLDKKIKEIKDLENEKKRLLDRMRAIEELQGNRPLIVRFFDEMIDSLPEGVSITRLAQTGQTITINGVAQSNARVSSFMRNLEASKWLANPELEIIQADSKSGPKISKFTLRFSQVVPKADGDESA